MTEEKIYWIRKRDKVGFIQLNKLLSCWAENKPKRLLRPEATCGRSAQGVTYWDTESAEKWPIKPSWIPHTKGAACVCREEKQIKPTSMVAGEQKDHEKTETKWKLCQEMEGHRS